MGNAWIGIGLGRTFSSVAVPGACPRQLRFGLVSVLAEDGMLRIPSLIAEWAGRLVAGTQAKRLALEGVATIDGWLYALETEDLLPIGPYRLWPAQVCATLLSHLGALAHDALGGRFAGVILTHPASFSVVAKDSLRRAAKLAGLYEVKLVPAAAAAIVAALDQHKETDRWRALVLHVGGASVEAAVVSATRGCWEVLASDCDRPGGAEIDEGLAERIRRRLAASGSAHNQVEEGGGQGRDRRFLDLSERVKIQRLGANRAPDAGMSVPARLLRLAGLLPEEAPDPGISISGAETNAIVASFIGRAMAIGCAAIDRARLRSQDLDSVLLVGGASPLPGFESTAHATFQCRVIADARTAGLEHAIGAALLAREGENLRETEAGLRRLDPEPRVFAFRIARSTGVPDHLTLAKSNPSDLVHFTVTHEHILIPGRRHLIDVWAHLDSQRPEVLKRAREAAGGDGRRARTKGPVKVARDALLAVSLYIPGINVEPCEELVLWEAEVASATFSVSVPPSAKHRLHQATAVVRVGGFKIAEVRFEVIVGQQGEGDPLRSAAGKAVHRAFASYAGEDRAAVLARVQGIQTS